jgi:hypothetical protein
MQRGLWFVLVAVCLSGCGSGSNEIRTYNLGDRVQAGPLVYTAFDTHWYLTLGQQTNPRVPANRFLVVHMTINNGGATDSAVPSISLLDDNGASINELTDGSGIPDWLGVIRKIKPMDAEKGTVAFDAAPKHYKLRVSDETDQIVCYIDLPLNLQTDDKTP